MDTAAIKAPRKPRAQQAEGGHSFKMISRRRVPLYPDILAPAESLVASLMKAATPENAPAQSNQGVFHGRQMHPFDMRAVTALQLRNEHHSTCIHTKVASTVGLGFQSDAERAMRVQQRAGLLNPQPIADPNQAPGNAAAPPRIPWQSEAPTLSLDSMEWKQSEVDDALDPYCSHSIADVMSDVAEDYWQTGNGYMEVVRALPGADGLGPITGIHHLPAAGVWINVEDLSYNLHYEVFANDGSANRIFAKFGDLLRFNNFITNNSAGQFSLIDPNARNTISEVIHFRRPTSLNRFYGFPDWLACAAAIELVQCLRQHKYDFFNNRGVPEFFLWLMGVKLSAAQIKQIEDAIQGNIGLGNAFKSLFMNFEGDSERMKVQLDHLQADSGTADSLEATNETYNLAIVTAHRVPPLLAGILIPGKLGSNNELPNALRAFQALCIGPAQRIFQQKLRATLGNERLNGGNIKLKPDNFTFRRISDEFDLTAMDTSSRMRQTEVAAQAEGRNLKAGVKK